jgi:hypothetical protein
MVASSKAAHEGKKKIAEGGDRAQIHRPSALIPCTPFNHGGNPRADIALNYR